MIELNSNNLRDNAKKIIKLVEELENNIDYIYNRMEGMPIVTGEWQGKAVNDFLKNIKKDKRQYKNFIKALRSFGNSLLNQAEKVDNCCRKVEL